MFFKSSICEGNSAVVCKSFTKECGNLVSFRREVENGGLEWSGVKWDNEGLRGCGMMQGGDTDIK